jgi:hypothetical protein
MEQDNKKPSSKMPTGMIKRANPLSLQPSTSTSPIKKVSKSTTVKVRQTVESLSGPKAFMFFLPLVNQDLLKTIKTTYPKLKLAEIVEKAFLQLLKAERPNAYDALMKTRKN